MTFDGSTPTTRCKANEFDLYQGNTPGSAAWTDATKMEEDNGVAAVDFKQPLKIYHTTVYSTSVYYRAKSFGGSLGWKQFDIEVCEPYS